MKIEYIGTLWGMEVPMLEAQLRKVKEGGFDGVEMGAPSGRDERHALRVVLDDLGLDLIVQQWTQGNSPQEHAQSFEEQYMRGIELKPLFINSHSGRDYFTTAENLVIVGKAADLEQKFSTQVMHETHRGRAPFSVGAARLLIEAMPQLKLTADFSHWCCVHESMLQDQADSLERAIERSYHIHARVGYEEGPQVSDPRAPEWNDVVETHIRWWTKIVSYRRQQGADILTICPEFGPPAYMPTLPYTRQPVADLWEVNCYMRDLLKERLNP